MTAPDLHGHSDPQAAKDARRRETKRRWREAHRDELAEKNRAWKQANPERVRELNRRWREAHPDRAREQNRESARRAAARRRSQAEMHRKARERAKAWREAHPDRVRENQKRWVEENRVKIRQYYNRYYASHRDEVNARAIARRDADPERTKRTKKEWAERNKERRAELQRARRGDPDVYQAELEANAAARRLKRRLARAGLPPKRVHPTSAAERRANERAAEAYFGDPTLNEHVRQLTVFQATLTEHMLEHGERMREFAKAYAERRAQMGMADVDVERITWARVVEVVTGQLRRVDLLTSKDVAAAVRGSKTAIRQVERREQHERLVQGIVTRVARNLDHFTAEAVLENRARLLHGKSAAPLDRLLVRLAAQEVALEFAVTRMNPVEALSVERAARTRLGGLIDRPSQPPRRTATGWHLNW